MTPSLQSAFCSDIDDVELWSPDGESPIDYWLQLYIGPDGEGGSEQFQVRVVSPVALHSGQPKITRSTLLVDQSTYVFADVLTEIERVVAACARPTWQLTAIALSRFFLWEYEDFSVVEE